jgi:DMSO/TMAO reductase YedYZ molybdopterin-dependent catalytic subunit
MGLERYVVDAVLLEKRGVSEVARAHGISRFWLYKLLVRFREGDYAALAPRSRRPHGCAHAASPAIQAAAVRWRHQLGAAGHDCGPHTIAHHLRLELGDSPSVATIWRILQLRRQRREHQDLPLGAATHARSPAGRFPDSAEYKALFDGNFADYRLRINGLVDNPVDLDMTQLRSLPHHEQITQHFCIQGWSAIAKWGGVTMRTIVDLVKPHPEVRWVVFYSLGEGADKGMYYDAHPIEHMSHHLTMLAYDMNGAPLSFGHGAPLRLRNEIELGFKQVKWIKGIEFVAHYSEIGSGYGGYNQDHEFFGYRQSI